MIEKTPTQRERELELAARIHAQNEQWKEWEPWILAALASLVSFLVGVYLTIPGA